MSTKIRAAQCIFFIQRDFVLQQEFMQLVNRSAPFGYMGTVMERQDKNKLCIKLQLAFFTCNVIK